MSDGPLTKLMRALGVESDLAPLASVKRITERPVSLNPECLFKMTPTPMQQSADDINRLWDGGPVLPSEVPERFLTTRKRHLPDILECRDCGKQFPREAYCPECDGTSFSLLVRAPSRSEIRHHTADRESALEEIDPEWRSRFAGDTDRAWDFYKPLAPERPATSAERELDEAIDEALDFDADLEDRNER
jgi:hypothetical protein